MAAFLAQDRQFRCEGGRLCGQTVAGALRRTGLAEVRRESLAEDLLAFLRALHDEVTAMLQPGRISSLPDVAFVPRPSHADTRHVGSWVCPCLGCAVVMVSQWSAWLTSPVPEQESPEGGGPIFSRRNPPQTVTFNLDVGMTSEEQLAYEMGALEVPADKGERRFVGEASNPSCSVCRAAADLRAEESLFAGRLPVVLAPIPGDVVELPAAWLEPPPPGDQSGRRAAAVKQALGRRQPLAHLGEEYAKAVVPAMPATDWQRSSGSTSGACGGSTREPAWPAELSNMPLLKVKPASVEAYHPSALPAVASGVRSALVRVRGRWWRLKGCGNRDEAFPVEAKGDEGELSVRGCLFEHTADTELRMTALASAALAAAGVDFANAPAGSYRYAAAPGWPLPKVERYCAVFHTLGNARLGDHLLAGLLLLLPKILPEQEDGFAALRAAIVAGRGADPNDEVMPTSLATSCEMPTADVALQLRRAGAPLAETAPPPAAEMAEQVPAPYARVWDAARAALADFLASRAPELTAEEPSLLLWLAWRLGWECGTAVRALHDAGISWGTYPDAMGIHCNAHVNNLVVKPPGAGRFPDTFLAPLDFDMAFTRESYLPEAVASHTGMGLDSWEGVLTFEASMGMKLVLSGSDFSSTGVANAADVPESHRLAEVAVRDTLVAAYEAARSGAGDDGHPRHAGLREGAYALIRLALCLTTGVEA